MKVNTDGILLGAWADVTGAKRMLDIGTGTGAIALMLAQKNTNATIDAIDISEDAHLLAKQNFRNSVWYNRLNSFHTSLQNLSASENYDVIVSNPPYFINDLKTSNPQKNMAKHTGSLSYEELISGINRLLSTNGRAFVVIPAFNFQLLESIAGLQNLFITKITEVVSVTGKAPYVTLLQLERLPKPTFKNLLEIETDKGVFSDEYVKLLKDFYLKM